MREDLASLTLAELAALRNTQRAALAAANAAFNRTDCVCKLVAKRLDQFPEEKLSHAVAALRLKRGHILPSGLLPPGTRTIDRTGLLARARTKFGVERTPPWLHNALKNRGGPQAIARDGGHWFYPRAEAEAWLDSLLSSLVDGRLPHDPALPRRRARERAEREREYAARERRRRAAGTEIATSFADMYRDALERALQQVQPTVPAAPSASNVVVFPSVDSNSEPPGAA